MKLKFTLFIAITFLSINAGWSQAKIFNPNPVKKLSRQLHTLPITANARAAVDTLIPDIFLNDECSLDLFTFSVSDGWGFVGGTNSFFDLEKAQRFYYDADNYEVLEVDVFFSVVSVVGDGQIVAKIYDVNETTGGPGELVKVSDPLNASDLATDPEFIVPTTFNFSTLAPLSSQEFFVSVELDGMYDAQDTVSIFMTDDTCGIGGDTWELFDDGETWVAFDDGNNGWGLSSNLFMIATVESDAVSSTRELVTGSQRIQLHDAFPNPADEEVNISVELQKAADISLNLYTVDGQLVQHFTRQYLPTGKHQWQISTNHLPNGIYFYGITTDAGQLMNKLVIER